MVPDNKQNGRQFQVCVNIAGIYFLRYNKIQINKWWLGYYFSSSIAYIYYLPDWNVIFIMSVSEKNCCKQLDVKMWLTAPLVNSYCFQGLLYKSFALRKRQLASDCSVGGSVIHVTRTTNLWCLPSLAGSTSVPPLANVHHLVNTPVLYGHCICNHINRSGILRKENIKKSAIRYHRSHFDDSIYKAN